MGRTCNSRFGLPVPLPPEDATPSIKVQQPRAEVLRRARLLVWDEAPMAPREALDAVDRLLRDIMETPDTPFGGKVLVLGGDFRQVLPISRFLDREAVAAHTIAALGHCMYVRKFCTTQKNGYTLHGRCLLTASHFGSSRLLPGTRTHVS